jgi:hypothetical protein
MHRHGWITALVVTALCACAGKAGPTGETGDAASATGSTSNGGGRVPSQHRAVAETCSVPAPQGNCRVTKSAFPGSCNTDSDCADAGPNGRCIEGAGGPAICDCTYDQCTVDADCGSGHVCSCRGDPYHYPPAGNQCVPANCRIDSDCGVGGYCSPSFQSGGTAISYYCHTAHDECIDDSDCAMPSSFCSYSTADGRWECKVVPAPG